MNEKQDLVAAIDIGTDKIVTIVGKRKENGKIEILGLSEIASKGIWRGVVLNIEDVVNTIKNTIKDLIILTEKHIYNVYVGINAQNIMNSVDIFNIKVDDYCNIITNLTASTTNINTCITKAGLIPNAMVLGLIASSDAVLTSSEKENGVALIDIGKGTTNIVVYHNDIIRHMTVIPFGGDLITRDIKEEFSISQQQAELLKVNYGDAFSDLIIEDNVVSISGINESEPKKISIKSLAQIIQWRAVDILDIAISEIKNSGYSDALNSGIILTGGGALLKHLPELIKFKTGIDVKIGFPIQHVTTDTIQKVNHPKYSTSVGLVLKGFEHMANTKKEFKYKVNKNSVTITKYIGKQTIVEIPELIDKLPVTKIGKNAFKNCKLSEIRISNTVNEIENSAFQNNCLTNVDLPNSIKKVGISAFQDNKLNKLYIPEKLLIIDYWSFADNMLSDVQFHSDLIEIKAHAFENNNLTNVSLPDSLKEIGISSFANNNLTELPLNKSVNETGKPILLDKLTNIKLIDLEYNHIRITSKFVAYEGTVLRTKSGKTYKGKNYKSVLLSDNDSNYDLVLCGENFDNYKNIFKMGKKYEITKEIVLSDWCTNGGFRSFKINSVIEK